MEYINENTLKNSSYENYPFPHTIIDNFLKNDKLDDILLSINNLNDDDAYYKIINPSCQFNYNKYAFNSNFNSCLQKLFIELNSREFISYLENISGIKELITNDINLLGAGIHRIKKGGHLQLHTDFNSYYNNYGKLDRRINLLIYMNPEWKEEYNGSLCLVDKKNNICVKKILPILNRCVIFNTSNKSIHGHPEILNTPENINRHSIAVYYYTKNNNNNNLDFEGDIEHSTIWYSSINNTDQKEK